MNKERAVAMDDVVLKVENLSKSFGKHKAVDSFSMEVKRGHICGLIGPNGAGKTTIMKMLAGLAAQDSGEMSFFGERVNLDKQRRRMSFMIEAPIIDTSMTAVENMNYVRYVRGVADESRIKSTLEFAGIANTGKKSVKNFSLGMKQRLGIAMSILPEPEIMVLDEPVNGLDPEGIVEVRNLLRKLAEEQGVTVIISSHLLAELSELCTDFILINHGKMIESFSAEELQIKCRNRICIKTDDINKTAAVLEEKLGLKEYKAVHGDELHVFELLDKPEILSKAITDSGLVITKFIEEGENLEEYYLSKVGGGND